MDFEHIEDLLKGLPEENIKEIERLLYGRGTVEITIPEATVKKADEGDFEIQARKFKHLEFQEQNRDARIVRVAAIQNKIQASTDLPMIEQYKAIEEKIEKMIDAAADLGANIVCLQEAWHTPFFFCTREKQPWVELAEEADRGNVADFISRKAKEHKMVIISPILERDSIHGDTLWNTACVFGDNGNYIGKHRKNHIPRILDFNESTYYMEGNTGHPVFETKYGKIAINICYGRHHVLNWMAFGFNGAEIVFNPSATVGAVSEPIWPIEARNAAIGNNYFAVGINRVGTEVYPREFTSGDSKPAHKDFGEFYGSSYVAGPDGSRSPSLSRKRDGVLVAEFDLNACRRIKDVWAFQMTARYPMYAEMLKRYSEQDFEPQVISDPSMK